MGISPLPWSYKNASFHCRDWWDFYGEIVIVVLSLNLDLGRPHRLTQDNPHPSYMWRFQAISWAPSLPLISYSPRKYVRLVSDSLHLLQAQRYPWLCRLMGQVQRLLPAIGLSLGKDLMWPPSARPTICKEMESKENGVSKDYTSSLAYSNFQKVTSAMESFLSLFWNTSLRLQPNLVITRRQLSSAVRKSAEWK